MLLHAAQASPSRPWMCTFRVLSCRPTASFLGVAFCFRCSLEQDKPKHKSAAASELCQSCGQARCWLICVLDNPLGAHERVHCMFLECSCSILLQRLVNVDLMHCAHSSTFMITVPSMRGNGKGSGQETRSSASPQSTGRLLFVKNLPIDVTPKARLRSAHDLSLQQRP